MAPDGGPGPPLHRRKPWRHPPNAMVWLLAAPAGFFVLDLVTPPSVRIGPMLSAVPVFAAVFCSVLRTLIVVLVTLGFLCAADYFSGHLGSSPFLVQMITVLLISLAALRAAAVRTRREHELAQVRWVAEATQRVLLRPLPARLGPLAVSSLYLAADDEAAIGGDLYAAAHLGGTARVLVGDAEGKGLAAVEAVSCVLSAFRRSTRRQVSLGEAAAYLERSLTDELEEIEISARNSSGNPAGERPAREGFVTAVVVDIPEDADRVDVLNRAHPPPIILRGDRVLPLDPSVPSLPLGLGDLFDDPERVDSAEFLPGDTLLLYTDGVIEARDSEGRFYPLTERLPQWADRTPDELLEAVRADLLRHTRARLPDDVAMVAIKRAP